MLGRIIQRDCLIEVLSAFYELSHYRQTKTHEAVPNHTRA